ncbi:MAG: COX15/CtaA family protein [Phycisphaeraceae bacterium]|nr:COX15/CtaA family protein [Phycisphaeraceae bacterium]
MPADSAHSPPTPDRFAAPLALGFGTAVAMWCAWFLTHLPGLNLPPAAVAGALLLAWVGAAAALSRAWGADAKTGAAGGVVTALVNLLALGSLLVEQADPATYAGGQPAARPNAALAAAGFVALGAVVGAIGGAMGSSGRAPQPALREGESWLGRLALVAAVAVVPLILIGGTVTSTESGLAVTGWPDTFGANMFLYPISLMSEPRVYFEHTHRLFGAMVGLCFLTLTVMAVLSPAGKTVRFWVVLTFAVVCVQGVLGGLRVTEGSAHLGIVHGVLGQVVLALAVCVAAWLSPLYRTAGIAPDPADRKRKALATGTLHALLMQLLLGAAFRHLRREDSPGAMHALWTHIGFSLVVVGLAFAAGFLLRSRAGADGVSRLIRRLGTGLVAVVGVQFALGWLAFWAVLSTPRRGPVPTSDQVPHAEAVPLAEALVGTLHQANGALLMALAALAVVWTRRAWRAGRGNPALNAG